jgi:hypothetical protein
MMKTLNRTAVTAKTGRDGLLSDPYLSIGMR